MMKKIGFYQSSYNMQKLVVDTGTKHLKLTSHSPTVPFGVFDHITYRFFCISLTLSNLLSFFTTCIYLFTKSSPGIDQKVVFTGNWSLYKIKSLSNLNRDETIRSFLGIPCIETSLKQVQCYTVHRTYFNWKPASQSPDIILFKELNIPCLQPNLQPQQKGQLFSQ